MAESLEDQVGDALTTDATALPVVPMPDLVTYECKEPGCTRTFSHAEPFEAHGQYLDHLADHDADEAEQEAQAARLDEEGASWIDG